MEELLPQDIIIITCENLSMNKRLKVNDKNANISIKFFFVGCVTLPFSYNSVWHPCQMVLKVSESFQNVTLHENWFFSRDSKNQYVLLAQSCLTLCKPRGLQPTRLLCPWNFPVRILEWVAISFSKGLPDSGSPELQADSLLSEPPGKPTRKSRHVEIKEEKSIACYFYPPNSIVRSS